MNREARDGEKRRGGARAKIAHSTVGEREGDREEPSKRCAIDRDSDQEAGAGLHAAGDQLGLGPVFAALQRLLESDGALDGRLARELEEAESQQASG